MTDKSENEIAPSPFAHLVAEDENNPEFRWYLMSVKSLCEKKASQNINVELEVSGLTDKVREILIPSVEVININKNGQKRRIQKKLFPNYIFIFADLDIELCSKINRVTHVLEFLNKFGSSLLPKPVPKREMEQVLNQLRTFSEDKQSLMSIQPGREVIIKDGTFSGYSGIVDSISKDLTMAKINLNILGRDTKIDISIKEVELSN
jgi:transcriptional antiterminator NusG